LGLADPEHEPSYIDRMIAVVGATFIESGLERAISQHFDRHREATETRKIFHGSGEAPGILGTFYSKIEMAFVLGVISNEAKDDLHIIREIRNAFSHSPLKMDFEIREVTELFEHIHAKLPVRMTRAFKNSLGMRGALLQFIVDYYYGLMQYDPDEGVPIEP